MTINTKIAELSARIGSAIASVAVAAADTQAVGRTPEYYGAVGDGIADDTDAVRAAVSTPGNVILNGRYSVNGRIQPVAGVRITGTGGIVMTGDHNASGFDLRAGQDDVTVRGIYIDGGAGRTTLSGGNGVIVLGANRCKIQNVRIFGWQNAGVLIENAVETVVEDCSIRDNEGVNVSLFGAVESVIRGNTLTNAGLENLTIDNSSHNSRVESNKFNTYRGGCGNVGWDNSDSAIFMCNLIDSEHTTDPAAEYRVGICFNGIDGSADFSNITGNTIRNNELAGVRFRDRTGGGFHVGGSGVLSGNVFDGNGVDIKVDAAELEIVLGANYHGAGSGAKYSIAEKAQEFVSSTMKSTRVVDIDDPDLEVGAHTVFKNRFKGSLPVLLNGYLSVQRLLLDNPNFVMQTFTVADDMRQYRREWRVSYWTGWQLLPTEDVGICSSDGYTNTGALMEEGTATNNGTARMIRRADGTQTVIVSGVDFDVRETGDTLAAENVPIVKRMLSGAAVTVNVSNSSGDSINVDYMDLGPVQYSGGFYPGDEEILLHLTRSEGAPTFATDAKVLNTTVTIHGFWREPHDLKNHVMWVEPNGDPSEALAVTWVSESDRHKTLTYDDGVTANTVQADYTRGTPSIGSRFIHTAYLTGLSADTEYTCTVQDTPISQKVTTARSTKAKVAFGSDYGLSTDLGETSRLGIMGERIAALVDRVDMIVANGDYTNDDGEVGPQQIGEWLEFMSTMQNKWQTGTGALIPTVWVVGNRDARAVDGSPLANRNGTGTPGPMGHLFTAGYHSGNALTGVHEGCVAVKMGTSLKVITLNTDHTVPMADQLPWALAEATDNTVGSILFAGHVPAFNDANPVGEYQFAWDASRGLRQLWADAQSLPNVHGFVAGHTHRLTLTGKLSMDLDNSLTAAQNDVRWRRQDADSLSMWGCGPLSWLHNNSTPNAADALVSSLDGSSWILDRWDGLNQVGSEFDPTKLRSTAEAQSHVWLFDCTPTSCDTSLYDGAGETIYTEAVL